ncbi:MAG: outer membrane beta-barrel protein [Bacteroidia bacterium]|nr:outer membrane beta-barrel protein [Bacteroidia bacterium]
MLQFKRSIVFSLLVISAFVLRAQHIEVGLLLGASNYMGDLSNETIVLKETHLSGAFFGRYNFSPRFAVKGFIGYGRVSGDDKNFVAAKRTYEGIADVEFNKMRNLNFYTDIYEFSVHAEYNLLPNDLKYYSARPFLPYVFAGIGVFNFNPKTKFMGKTIELQPLGTEGQGSTNYNSFKKYALTTICIPVGIGFRQKIGDDFFLGFEAGLRFTTTNYMDDVGGKYGDRFVIGGATGKTALLLSDRSWELDPANDPNTDKPLGLNYLFSENNARSDRKLLHQDMYIMCGITFSYVIRFKGQGCPSL